MNKSNMKMQLVYGALYLALASCTDNNGKVGTNQTPTNNIKFSDVALAVPDTSQTSKSEQTNPLGARNVGGYAAKYWGKLLKNCIQSSLIPKNSLDYLGPSNTIGLGAIADENLETTKRRFDKSMFTDAELASIIDYGQPTSCEYKLNKDINLEALLEGQVQVTDPSKSDLEVNLRSAIANKRSSTIEATSWQKQEIITGALRDALSKKDNALKTQYYDDMLKKGNIIMTRVVKVNGFKATIKLSNSLDAGLKAALKDGLSAKIGEAKGSLSIKSQGDKELLISSTNEFYIYGKFVKAEKL